MRLPAMLVFLSSTVLALGPGNGDQDQLVQGNVHVTVTRRPEKRLDFEVVVPASRADVWKAFTTPEGMTSWLAPSAQVELKIGGLWQVGFAGAAPGGGTILSFLPMEMLSVNAMAPERFPTVRRERTQAVFRFEAVDALHTRVTLSQIGWKSGEEWDQAFDYLSRGNAELLNLLYRRFHDGPIQWDAGRGKS